MYTHISKGFTVGQVITRRVFRTVTGVPGFMIDMIIALFWTSPKGTYLAYWEEAYGRNWRYSDGSTGGGMQLVTGSVGDWIGYLVGGLVGAVVGLAVYFPDVCLRVFVWAYDKLNAGLERLSYIAGQINKILPTYSSEEANTYPSKAWNIAVITFGVFLAAPLFLVCKAIEFVLPIFKNDRQGEYGLSDGVGQLAASIGGLLAWVVAIACYPVKHVLQKAVDLVQGFRSSVRTLTAIIYAKVNQTPVEQDDLCDGFNVNSVHSLLFRDKVRAYKQHSVGEIILAGGDHTLLSREPVIPAAVPNYVAPEPFNPANYQPLNGIPGGANIDEAQVEGRPNNKF